MTRMSKILNILNIIYAILVFIIFALLLFCIIAQDSRIDELEQKMSLIENRTLSFDHDESGDLILIWSVIEEGVEYPYARLPALPQESGEEDD